MFILLPARSSDRIHASKSRLPLAGDGRLGSSLPALWVCLRQMGPCIHLLAPCLSTVRGAQVCGGAYAAPLDRASPPGLCFQVPICAPRYGDRGAYRTASARLAVWHILKKPPPPFSVNCRLNPEDPEPITTQCAQVECSAGTVHQQQRDYYWFQFRPRCERAVGIGFCSMTFKLGSEFEFRKL